MNLKKSIFSVMLLILISGAAFADPVTIKINKIPQSAEEFTELRNDLAKTPEGGAAMMILSMLVFSENEETGLQCMTIALDSYNVSKGNVYKGYAPANHLNYHINRFRQKKYWPKAYIKGTTPDNGYAYSVPIEFTFSRNKYSGDESKGKVKVFVDVYGVSARPITMVKNNKGIWKAKELSSLFVDPPAPKVEVDDEL